MGKFIKAKFKTSCKQTQQEINIGDDIYYIPGIGSFSKESNLYQNEQGEARKRNQGGHG